MPKGAYSWCRRIFPNVPIVTCRWPMTIVMLGRCYIAPYLKLQRTLDIRIHLLVFHRRWRGKPVRSNSRLVKTWWKRDHREEERLLAKRITC
jgi:hypothetical protein